MQNKIFKLFVAFVVLCSLQGFSQTADKSDHPLLDKYYPQKQNIDTNKTVATQIKPVPTPNPVPAPAPAPAPISTTIPVVTNKPVSKAEPAKPTEPVTTTLSAINTEPSETKPPVAANTPVESVSPIVAEKIPEQKKVPTQPPPSTYMDTRLGSSTPQYDTWKKNNNGAGSVTTSPK